MTRHERILSDLSVIARDVEPVGQARICAGIVYKRQLVGVGVNLRRTDPMAKRFQRNPEAISGHAEINAIKNSINRMRGADFLKDSTLYVARQKIVCGEWVDGMAAPCPGCERAIEAFGIKRVYYTED